MTAFGTGHHALPPEMALFVRLGLGAFAQRRGVDLTGTLEPEYLGPSAIESWDAVRARAAARPPTCRIERVASDFALDPADRHLLAMLVSVECDWRVGAAVGRLQAQDGAARDPRPTLHLAETMALVLFSARCSPLAVSGSRLVAAGALRVLGDGPMPFRRLEMPPPLAALLSEGPPDWPGCSRIMADAPVDDDTATALRRIAPQIAAGEIAHLTLRAVPVAGRAAATVLAQMLGLTPLDVAPDIWAQDAALRLGCRYGRMLPVVRLALGPGARWDAPTQAMPSPAVYLLGADGGVAGDGGEILTLAAPDRAARAQLWADYAPPVEAARLADLAALDAATIRRLGNSARLAAGRDGGTVDIERILSARRVMGAERLARLAHPVTRPAPAAALILPDGLHRRFDRLVDRCRGRETVAEGLGMAIGSVGLSGVSALFAGPSGTGKTFAASHLAERLATPLWRLDLSAVMNKYIGETEKNLSAALDEAEALDVALLLDEADALFGRRGDGDGEGERFANMLTNFLLSRLERHRGVTVLTTNARNRMDPAFTRRFDFIFDFPLPAHAERLAIWRAHLGSRAPDADAMKILATQCELAGGFVRTAALNAAAAAPGRGPIPLATLAEAAVEEYRKIGRAVPDVLARLAAHG